MKPRHSAALALVGWYLMVPPMTPDGAPYIDATAPIYTWEIVKNFDRAKDCDATIEKMWRYTASDEGKANYREHGDWQGRYTIPYGGYLLRIANAQCVASNDARLAK